MPPEEDVLVLNLDAERAKIPPSSVVREGTGSRTLLDEGEAAFGEFLGKLEGRSDSASARRGSGIEAPS